MRCIISVVFVCLCIASTVLAEETKAEEPKAVEPDDKLEAADRNERQINWRKYSRIPPYRPAIDPGWAGPAYYQTGRRRIIPYRPTIDPGWAGPAYYQTGRRTPPYRPPLDPWFAGPAKPSWWRSQVGAGAIEALTPDEQACNVLCPGSRWG